LGGAEYIPTRYSFVVVVLQNFVRSPNLLDTMPVLKLSRHEQPHCQAKWQGGQLAFMRVRGGKPVKFNAGNRP
jgi:hypothetical protein